MKHLLLLVVLAEAATGVVMAAYPPLVVRLLLGQPIADAGVLMSRLAGLCLLTLAVACWPDGSHRPYDGMVTWSAVALLYLVFAGLGGHAGILLWPAAAGHAVIVVLLLRARASIRTSP